MSNYGGNISFLCQTPVIFLTEGILRQQYLPVDTQYNLVMVFLLRNTSSV